LPGKGGKDWNRNNCGENFKNKSVPFGERFLVFFWLALTGLY